MPSDPLRAGSRGFGPGEPARGSVPAPQAGTSPGDGTSGDGNPGDGNAAGTDHRDLPAHPPSHVVSPAAEGADPAEPTADDPGPISSTSDEKATAGASPAQPDGRVLPALGGQANLDAADLVRARTVLLRGPRKLPAEQLRSALVDLHDFWLASRATVVGIGAEPGDGLALIAVGALGRRELAPYSDLDLVLLHDGGSRRDPASSGSITAVAERLWYPLWDAGIGLDHSVRTPAEALKLAGSDLKVALGLLEARRIAGDPELADTLITGARQSWRAGVRNRFDELVTAAEQRWARSGQIAHRVEPDLKHGHGGLRDIDLIAALASAQLVDRPGTDLLAARGLLLDVRTELHRLAGRARDILRAQEADEVAAALDMGDRFDLARALSGAARTVVYATDVALRAARASLPRRGLSVFGIGSGRRFSRQPVRRPLDEGVVEHGGEVALARDAAPARDPVLVLRVAAASATSGLPIAPGTLVRLADTAPELREPWPREARDALLALLGAGRLDEGRHLIDVIEALDRTGLWGRLFPEWGAVRDLPPRDRAHIWTVDRHLVQAVVHAAALTTQVGRPDLLLLAALVHDIGKGRGGDHCVVGAALADQIGRRLGLWPADVATLERMVRHHLLLPDTVGRRDLDNPATIESVVDQLGRDAVLLELLSALAEADAKATGPGVWSDWRATLIHDLVRRCRAVLAGQPLPGPEPLDDKQRELADQVRTDDDVHVVLDESVSPPVATVVAPDRRGLLSKAAGVLALHSLQVHGAAVRSVDSVAVDAFAVSPRFGRLPDPALLRQDLIRAIEGTLDLSARLAAKERDYAGASPPAEGLLAAPAAGPARLIWSEPAPGVGENGPQVCELRAGDRIGLLYRVAAVLEEYGLDVRWAKVATLGASVVDAFCVVGPSPDGSVPAALRSRVEQAILRVAQ
jgi:[protein-PII] uridylyltransferase